MHRLQAVVIDITRQVAGDEDTTKCSDYASTESRAAEQWRCRAVSANDENRVCVGVTDKCAQHRVIRDGRTGSCRHCQLLCAERCAIRVHSPAATRHAIDPVTLHTAGGKCGARLDVGSTRTASGL